MPTEAREAEPLFLLDAGATKGPQKSGDLLLTFII